MSTAPGIAALVLAAGGSTRLGEPKQLLQFNGRSLLRGAAERALAAGCAPVIVVLGAQADAMRAELEGLKARVVENVAWQEGMGASIRAGMAALAWEQSDAVLLMLCDQPLVTAAALRRLVTEQRATGKSIVASDYAGALGVPALFAREHFAELAAVGGQEGAKRVIARHRAQVAALLLPEAAYDIDTATDYARLLRAQSDASQIITDQSRVIVTE